jgi:arginine/serine-rich splicing factor 4/5/6
MNAAMTSERNVSTANRIFVGRLSERIKEEDLREIFMRYGTVVRLDLKGGFAFLFFETEDQMDTAILNMNGQTVDNKQIVVEKARGTGTKADFEGRGANNNNAVNNNRSNGSRDPRDVRGMGQGGPRQVVKRFDLRVTARGFDSSVTWSDLKDWARSVGDVTFTNVFKRDDETLGVIEFGSEKDLEKALETLHGSKLKEFTVSLEKDDTAEESWNQSKAGQADEFRERRQDNYNNNNNHQNNNFNNNNNNNNRNNGGDNRNFNNDNNNNYGSNYDDRGHGRGFNSNDNNRGFDDRDRGYNNNNNNNNGNGNFNDMRNNNNNGNNNNNRGNNNNGQFRDDRGQQRGFNDFDNRGGGQQMQQMRGRSRSRSPSRGGQGYGK